MTATVNRTPLDIGRPPGSVDDIDLRFVRPDPVSGGYRDASSGDALGITGLNRNLNRW